VRYVCVPRKHVTIFSVWLGDEAVRCHILCSRDDGQVATVAPLLPLRRVTRLEGPSSSSDVSERNLSCVQSGNTVKGHQSSWKSRFVKCEHSMNNLRRKFSLEYFHLYGDAFLQ